MGSRRLAGALALAALPLLVARGAAAVEAFDGRLQLHGFAEVQLRTLSRDFTDDWDLSQWYNVLNLEFELDLLPAGWGPITALSAFSRVEVRYDCLWTHGCGLFPSADLYGDRANKAPSFLTNARESAFAGTTVAVTGRSLAPGVPDVGGGNFGIDNPTSFGTMKRLIPDRRVAGLPVLFEALFASKGPNLILNSFTDPSERCDNPDLNQNAGMSFCSVSGTVCSTDADCPGIEQCLPRPNRGCLDDPAPLAFAPFLDYGFLARQVEGPDGGNGTQFLGPWHPKNKIHSVGSLSLFPNALNSREISPSTGNTGSDHSDSFPFRPTPLFNADQTAPVTEARGLYFPSPGLQRALSRESSISKFDQNFRQDQLAWNRGASQQDEKELKELYFDLELLDGRLWLRMGKQTIVWGKTELFRSQDQFNPQDIALATLPSLEESRIGLWAARATYSFYDIGPFEDVRLELAVLTDQFEPADLGRCGEPYAPLPVCSKAFGLAIHGGTGLGLAGEIRPEAPWNSGRGVEAGARVEWRWSRFSFALTDFYGYDDFPVPDALFDYERNVDPRTGRPRRANSRGGCDPDDLFGGRDISGCLPFFLPEDDNPDPRVFTFGVTPLTGRRPVNSSGDVLDNDTGLPTPDLVTNQTGEPPADGATNPLLALPDGDGRPDNEALYRDVLRNHSVNQTLFHVICAGTIGFVTFIPGAEEECSVSVFASQQTFLFRELATGISLVLAGGAPIFVGGVLGFFVDPALVKLVPLSIEDNINPNPIAPQLLGVSQTLNDALTPEQQALIGCGPFYGNDCDLQAVDLLNVEASALLQSFPGFDGTVARGFRVDGMIDTDGDGAVDTFVPGMQPGTVPFQARHSVPCTRFEGGLLYVLPGCRGPETIANLMAGAPGVPIAPASAYNPAIDGDPVFDGAALDPTRFSAFNVDADAGIDCPDITLADSGTARLMHPWTCELWASEMAALSWNFLQLVVLFSVDNERQDLDGDGEINDDDDNPTDGEPDDGPEIFEEDEFNPDRPLDEGRCSLITPQYCSQVVGLLQLAGNRRRDVRAGSNGRYGRRDFLWSGAQELILFYPKRNVLGLSMDFAEDVTKTNWGLEFTWVEDLPLADANSPDGTTQVDQYRLTVSVDRPTFINFMNANRTFFFNSQWFFSYTAGYTDAFTSNGPLNVLATFTAFTGYFQDRLNAAATFVYDIKSASGAILPSFNYRFTEDFSVTFGMALFMGHFEAKLPPVRPVAVGNNVGSGAYKQFVENGLSVVRERDELFLRIRWTF